ncbi:helix-turn-helix domain-containing protein [Arcticibacter sp. MXS-1]|uniref:helix-turn-helix domain-containing protein n=1 Tax=Arcticibacter sp. MXS-1 TaxID=3341726 RepID=UPI0035A8BC86
MKMFLRIARSAFESVRLLGSILSELKSHPAQSADDVWLDSMQVARLLQVSERTVYRYKLRGILKAVRVGGKDFYRKSDIFPLLPG